MKAKDTFPNLLALLVIVLAILLAIFCSCEKESCRDFTVFETREFYAQDTLWRKDTICPYSVTICGVDGEFISTSKFWYKRVMGGVVDSLWVVIIKEYKIITMNDLKQTKDVMAAYCLPNGTAASGTVVAYNWEDEQIQGLQGKYTKDLHKQILDRSTSETRLVGFPEID